MVTEVLSSKIKYLVTDCDGVLTNGNYYCNDDGKQFITFNSKDSLAVHLIKRSDLKFFIISSTSIPNMVQKRADDWGVEFYRAPPLHKLEVLKGLVDLEATAYIGDSIDDIEVFHNVRLAFAPADAIDLTRDNADYILKRKGGDGCILEAFLHLRNYDISR